LANYVSGVLIVHACSAVFKPALVQAIAKANITVSNWQDLERNSACHIDLTLDYSEVMTILESLSTISELRFEVILWTAQDFTGERWVWAPKLGLGCAQIDASGNHVVGEGRLREILREAGDNSLKIERMIRKEMLTDWDDEFEQLRERSISQANRLPRVS